MIIQFPNGVRSFDHGHIEEIIENQLFYHIGGDHGSSGSPVMLWSGEAIGMHTKRIADSEVNNSENAGPKRIGTSMYSIVQFFFQQQVSNIPRHADAYQY